MTVRAAARWVTNWRNGAVLAASVLAVVLLLVVTDAIDGRQQAFSALERQTEQAVDARRAATRRIDLLQTRIDDLVGRGESNAELLGQLVAEVEALRAQVRDMGGNPVVAAPVATSTEPGIRPSTTTTTTTRPPASPTTTTTSTTAALPPAGPTTTTTSAAPGPVCRLVRALCAQGAN